MRRQARSTDNPVFIALRDAQQRFGISIELLDQLVQGTMLDLTVPVAATEMATYQTFDELYRYCFLVASVVGLVCIRIFGYTDPRAEGIGGTDRHRVPANKYSARRSRGRGTWPDLSSA